MDKAMEDILKPDTSIVNDFKVEHKGKTYCVPTTNTESYDAKNLPSTLILSVNRVRPSIATAPPSKDTAPIRFKPTLVLDSGRKTYLLTQILVHWGPSPDRGHYSCFSRNNHTARTDPKWTHLNDSVSTEMTFTDVRHFFIENPTNTASLFIYDELRK
jgi:uncharacterized UBP type Zn finger protein